MTRPSTDRKTISLAGLGSRSGSGASGGGFGFAAAADPDAFLTSVNHILERHAVAWHLHHNSRLVPVQSHGLPAAIVAPTLYLLHSQPRLAGAETAYQDALRELRNRAPGDAITDAGTAMQDALAALGCDGGSLGEQLKAAKKMALIRDSDTPLTDAVIRWVATQRNRGEAHRGGHDFTMSDAWMIVHVVGALIIRLSESEQV